MKTYVRIVLWQLVQRTACIWYVRARTSLSILCLRCRCASVIFCLRCITLLLLLFWRRSPWYYSKLCLFYFYRGISSTPKLLEPVLQPRTALYCGDELMWEQQQVQQIEEWTTHSQSMRDILLIYRRILVYIGMAIYAAILLSGGKSMNKNNCCRLHTLTNVGHTACDINTSVARWSARLAISGNQNASKPCVGIQTVLRWWSPRRATQFCFVLSHCKSTNNVDVSGLKNVHTCCVVYICVCSTC